MEQFCRLRRFWKISTVLCVYVAGRADRGDRRREGQPRECLHVENGRAQRITDPGQRKEVFLVVRNEVLLSHFSP